MQTTTTRPNSVLTCRISCIIILYTLSICHGHDQSNGERIPRRHARRPSRVDTSWLETPMRFSAGDSRLDPDWNLAESLERALESDESECGVPLPPNARNLADNHRHHKSDRIWNGALAKEGQFPWMARMRRFSGILTEFLCGATIVSDRHLLTAAHCVSECIEGKSLPLEPSRISLLVGRVHYNWFTANIMRADVQLQNISVPRAFNACSLRASHDYAVLLATEPMQLRSKRYPDSNINRICLPKTRWKADPTKTAIIAGWGETYHDSGESYDLFWSSTHFEGRCYESYGDDTTFCARGRNGSSCRGDSGGAAIVELSPGRWTQVGIISSYDSNTADCSNKTMMFFNARADNWQELIARL